MRRCGFRVSSSPLVASAAASVATSSSTILMASSSSSLVSHFAAAGRSTTRRFYASLSGARGDLGVGLKELSDICEGQIRDQMPTDGSAISAADFGALVESAFPNRAYNALGLYTVREVAEACPRLFHVVADDETGWYTVARVDAKEKAKGGGLRPISAHAKDASRYIFIDEKAKTSATPSSSSAAASASGATVTVATDFVPLEEALTAEAANVPIVDVLRYVQSSPNYKVRTLVTVQPRPVPHGAHVLVDGDGLSKEDVTQLFQTLKLTTVGSTRNVIRQAASPSHSATDVVCRAPTQTFQIVENQLEQLCVGSTIVLKPVVVMCAESQRQLYATVLRRYSGKMGIMLCTPSSVAHA